MLRDILEAFLKLRSEDDGRVHKFLSDVHGITRENPLAPHQRTYGEAVVSVQKDAHPNTAYVSDLKTTSIGNGHASSLIQKLCSLADRHQVSLHAVAKKTSKEGLTLDQLIGFYGRYGFKRVGPPTEGGGQHVLREPKAHS